MEIQTLKIPLDGYIKQGNTIPKIVFTIDPLTDIDLEAEGVEINMQVYANVSHAPIIDVSIGSGITVTGTRVFEIDTVPYEENCLPAGVFKGDLEVLYNGEMFTYFDVEYTIIEQYTKK